jgi:hypothetical protein
MRPDPEACAAHGHDGARAGHHGSPIASPSTCEGHPLLAAMLTTAGCCATVEIINPGCFAATIVIFVRSTAS